jgi:hypothetical protein
MINRKILLHNSLNALKLITAYKTEIQKCLGTMDLRQINNEAFNANANYSYLESKQCLKTPKGVDGLLCNALRKEFRLYLEI